LQESPVFKAVMLTFMLHIHFGKQRWHIAITDLQATFLHGLATHCNRISYQMFLICKFRLRISMNYTKNVGKLLAHAQTVDRLYQVLLSSFCRAPGNETTINSQGGPLRVTVLPVPFQLLLWSPQSTAACCCESQHYVG